MSFMSMNFVLYYCATAFGGWLFQVLERQILIEPP